MASFTELQVEGGGGSALCCPYSPRLVPTTQTTYLPIEVQTALDKFLQQLLDRTFKQSREIARKTAELLKLVVEKSKNEASVEPLCSQIHFVGDQLIKAAPLEFVICNVIQRVLCIVRDEMGKPREQNMRPRGQQASTANRSTLAAYFDPGPPTTRPSTQTQSAQTIIENWPDLITEELIYRPPGSNFLKDLFNSTDTTIMVYGYSHAVEELLYTLRDGFQRRTLCLIIVAGDVEGGADKMAKVMLEKRKVGQVNVTVVPDTAVFALMPHVDKVVMGTRAILSSGGAITLSGGQLIAQAAKCFERPLFLVAPIFKVTFLPIFDPLSQNAFGSLHDTYPGCSVDPCIKRVSVPLFDLVPSNCITAYITDIGVFHPTSIYSLAKQRYHQDDIYLSALAEMR